MAKKLISEGDVFGKWTVISEMFRVRNTTGVLCRCECGNVRSVECTEMRCGRSTSCGCKGATFAHGHKPRDEASITYNSWQSMKTRCGVTGKRFFKNYKGRGITVCKQWETFDVFLRDMGERPTLDHTLDRIDNNGNYEPGNCRWATRKEQSRNTRTNRLITISGVTKCLTDWCQETGVGRSIASSRICRGWSPEKAVTVPANAIGRHFSESDRRCFSL